MAGTPVQARGGHQGPPRPNTTTSTTTEKETTMTTITNLAMIEILTNVTAQVNASGAHENPTTVLRDELARTIAAHHNIDDAAELFVIADKHLPEDKTPADWNVWQGFKFAVTHHADQEAATMHEAGDLHGLLDTITDFAQDWETIIDGPQVVRRARSEAAQWELWKELKAQIGREAFVAWYKADGDRMTAMLDNGATHDEVNRETIRDIATQLELI